MNIINAVIQNSYVRNSAIIAGTLAIGWLLKRAVEWCQSSTTPRAMEKDTFNVNHPIDRRQLTQPAAIDENQQILALCDQLQDKDPTVVQTAIENMIELTWQKQVSPKIIDILIKALLNYVKNASSEDKNRLFIFNNLGRPYLITQARDKSVLIELLDVLHSTKNTISSESVGTFHITVISTLAEKIVLEIKDGTINPQEIEKIAAQMDSESEKVRAEVVNSLISIKELLKEKMDSNTASILAKGFANYLNKFSASLKDVPVKDLPDPIILRQVLNEIGALMNARKIVDIQHESAFTDLTKSIRNLENIYINSQNTVVKDLIKLAKQSIQDSCLAFLKLHPELL